MNSGDHRVGVTFRAVLGEAMTDRSWELHLIQPGCQTPRQRLTGNRSSFFHHCLDVFATLQNTKLQSRSVSSEELSQLAED